MKIIHEIVVLGIMHVIVILGINACNSLIWNSACNSDVRNSACNSNIRNSACNSCVRNYACNSCIRNFLYLKLLLGRVHRNSSKGVASFLRFSQGKGSAIPLHLDLCFTQTHDGKRNERERRKQSHTVALYRNLQIAIQTRELPVAARSPNYKFLPKLL
jgi:hypothetical protein